MNRKYLVKRVYIYSNEVKEKARIKLTRIEDIKAETL